MERLNALNICDRGLVTALFAYDDDFIDQGLRKLTLEQALFVYLRNNGYETIVFYSTANGFYSFDADMLGNFLSPVNNRELPLEDVVVEQSPVGHPTGRRRFTRRRGKQILGENVSGNVNVTRQNLNATPDPFGRFKTRSVGDRNANMAEFGYNLRERRHLAVIVMASEDAPEFDPTQTNILGTQLRDTEQYGRQRGNDNRLIIVIPADKCRENIMRCFNQHDHPISSVFLGGTFHNRFVQTMGIEKGEDVETVNPQSTMVLAPPTKIDIRRVLMCVRMQTGSRKLIDWLHIDDICEQLSLGKQHKLTTINSMMKRKQEYTYEAFKNDGVRSRGSDIKSLNQLVGLDGVKNQIQEFVNRIELRRSRGEDITHMNKHMVFYGSPGTGKTTVARIVAGILKDLGLVSKGHLVEVGRADLVAGYVGQTAIRTRQVIDSALDGILFVDEAYQLADGGENDFGREAVNALLARMENDRHRLVVILAGYEPDMERLYNINEGIRSRINTYLDFKDYTADELKQIFMLTAHKYYSIPPETDKLLDEMMSHVVEYKERCYEQQRVQQATHSGMGRTMHASNYKFGNGRWVRNLLELVEGKVAARQRWSDTSKLLPEDFVGLKIDELENFVPGKKQRDEEQHENGMSRINAMIGLTQLKGEVMKIVKQVRYAQMLEQRGKPVPQGIISRHMVFLGNPGTGKTTVARIMADIYYELKLIQKKTIVEVDRSKLVAEYEGQTAPRVNKVFDSALGGILFVDEAYSLVRSRHDPFGQEALDTLVKRIEDDKDKLVVILAGYEREMREFIAKNSGLKSRFSTYIHFQDYTPDEMLQILLGFLTERGLEVTSVATEKLSVFINQELTNASSESGNGRWARNLADKLYEAHTSHCVDINSFSSSLCEEEIDAGLNDFMQSQLID